MTVRFKTRPLPRYRLPVSPILRQPPARSWTGGVHSRKMATRNRIKFLSLIFLIFSSGLSQGCSQIKRKIIEKNIPQGVRNDLAQDPYGPLDLGKILEEIKKVDPDSAYLQSIRLGEQE
jgi:hypothetical protein